MDAKQDRVEFGGRMLSIEQIVELLHKQQQTITRLERELERLRKRLAQYEPEVLNERGPGSGSDEPSSATHYSLEAEEKRRKRRKRKKKSPGRKPNHLKFSAADQIEDVYPPGARKADCRVVRERAVWRIIEGRAVRVGYRIFSAPGHDEPRIFGLTPRCEYGIEILVVLAFLVYMIGISLDKACAVLRFFCGLPLAKSEADALLRQLARHWETEFETLCDLLAHSAVVYMDETGWKIGAEGCSVWTFASDLVRVFLFGCRKDAATLEQMLPSDLFDGVAVSDDAAVYRNRFHVAQKCWAHLLRKAIRLALLYPRKKSYRHFLDRLLALYYDAKRAAADDRLGDAGRRRHVAEFEGRLCELCQRYQRDITQQTKPHERDFINLVNELVARTLDEELFTFVLDPRVDPTNNLAERLQRGTAQDRKAGRTSKTPAGAQRRSVIVSVLESLKANLPTFTLASVLAEIDNWLTEGLSRFEKDWQQLLEAAPTAPESG